MRRCSSRVEYANRQLKDFRASIIRIFIEMCLDISVCASIEMLMRQVLTTQEKLSFFISMFLLTVLLIGLFYSTFLIKTKKYKIE